MGNNFWVKIIGQNKFFHEVKETCYEEQECMDEMEECDDLFGGPAGSNIGVIAGNRGVTGVVSASARASQTINNNNNNNKSTSSSR